MNAKQSTILQTLLCITVLVAIVLCYKLLAPNGLAGLSPMALATIIALTLALVMAAFAPAIFNKNKALHSAPIGRADMKFYVAIALVGMTLAVIGTTTGMLWIMMLGILLGPLCLVFRKGGWR